MADLDTVSIVIPVYNAEAWLAETLISVLQQTYPTSLMDITIVDDGSSDQSIAVAHNFLSSVNIKYEIIKVNNGGPSRARNIGWQQAKGEWIQFLDADDLLVPQKIAFQMEALQKQVDPPAVIYSTWQRLTYFGEANWHPYGELVTPLLISPLPDLLGANNFIHLGSSLIHRKSLEQVQGFDERYRLVEDVHLMVRIAMAGGQFYHAASPAPLFFYRQSKNSLSKNKDVEFVQACLRNVEMVYGWLQSQPQISDRKKQILCEAYAYIARASYSNDPSTFKLACQQLNVLSGHRRYIPTAPHMLKWLSYMLGYPHAELIAYWYRRIIKYSFKIIA